MQDEKSENFFNYKKLHSFYNNYWADIAVNLFTSELKPKKQ